MQEKMGMQLGLLTHESLWVAKTTNIYNINNKIEAILSGSEEVR